MLRLIATFVLLFSWSQASLGTPTQKKTQQKEAPANPKSTEVASQPRSLAPSGQDSSQPESPKSQTKNNVPNYQRRDWVDRTMAISTAVLSLFTLGMAVVIFRQLRATQLSERAWVTGSPEFNNFTRAPASNEYIVYPVSYTNVGKSPARLMQAGVSLKMIESLSNLPKRPAYLPSELAELNQVLLVPGDSFALTAPPIQMTEAQYWDMRNSRVVLWAHGFVKYRDIFGRKHETVFCHYYRLPEPTAPTIEGFSRCINAPSGYNKAT